MSGIGGKFFELLYPSQCLGCNLWFAFREDAHLCDVCSTSISSSSSRIIKRVIDDVEIYSRFYYGSSVIINIIHSLKYERVFGAAELCGRWIAPLLAQFDAEKTVFLPVPLHMTRLRERGFNQAELICRLAGQYAMTTKLVRLIKTKKQSQLKDDERYKNVFQAFGVISDCDPELTYVLVDDVVTSGNTLRDCFRVLRNAGAHKIYGVTVASTGNKELL